MLVFFIATIYLCGYVILNSKRNRTELIIFAIYPFIFFFNKQLSLYLLLIIVLKEIYKSFCKGEILIKKEHIYLAILPCYFVLCIPFQNLSHEFIVGIRNIIFFALSGYLVVRSVRFSKILPHVIEVQIIFSFLLCLYQIYIDNTYYSYYGRVPGFFYNPNYSGLYLVFLILLIERCMYGKRKKVAFFFLLISLILTKSEACYLSLLYLMYAHFFKGKADIIIYNIGIILMLVGFTVLFYDPVFLYEFPGAKVGLDRLQIWAAYAYVFFHSNKLIGVGFNQEISMYDYAAMQVGAYNEAGRSMMEVGFMPTHNEIFKILVGTGIIGFLIFYICYTRYVKRVSKNNWIPNTGLVLLIFMLTHNVLFTSSFWFIFFLPLLEMQEKSSGTKYRIRWSKKW